MGQKRTFRIGTTSYIYPDKMLPNVRKLKGFVDDIELVLFEVKDESNIPAEREIRELRRMARDGGLTYTVHLPLHLDLGCANKKKRRADVEKTVHLIDDLKGLEPFAYVLHLNLPAQAKRTIEAWQNRINGSLLEISSAGICNPANVVVENLGYPFRFIEDIVERNGFSVCVDIGHLFYTKEKIADHLRRHLPRTKVIHWHGILNGKDHLSLKHASRSEVQEVIGLLRENQYKGVVTLEVFSQDDFETSMKALQAYL